MVKGIENLNKQNYRIDFFKYDTNTGMVTEHIVNGFNDVQDAVNAASEGRRDGYVTWLLKHVFENQYTPVVKLV